MTTAATIPTVTVEPDALAYADRVGKRAALDHMLAATLRLIPGLLSVHVRLEPDWDYPEQMNYVWEVRIDPTTRDVRRDVQRAWADEVFAVVPERPPSPFYYFKLREDAP